MRSMTIALCSTSRSYTRATFLPAASFSAVDSVRNSSANADDLTTTGPSFPE
jgi:hypothetical protein